MSDWRCYYQNTNAVIYVVDSNDPERMGISKQELMAMLEEEELKDAALIVFANKQDLPNSLPSDAIASELGLGSLKNRKLPPHSRTAHTPKQEAAALVAPVHGRRAAQAAKGERRRQQQCSSSSGRRIAHTRSAPVTSRSRLAPLSLSLSACALSGNWAIFKTSAIKGDGLFEGLDWLVATLREGK